ncbi:Spy/CpxP family protein refolding chaperone [Fibrobacterota bacterium]
MNTLRITAILFFAFMSLALAQPPGQGGTPPCMKGLKDGPGNKPGFINPMVIKELNLSDDQRKYFKDYKHKMRKEKIQLRSEISQLEEDLRFEFSQYPLNKSEIEAMKKKLIVLKGKMTAHKIDGMLHFLGKLNKEQHQKFVDLQDQYGLGSFGSGPRGMGQGRGRGPR